MRAMPMLVLVTCIGCTATEVGNPGVDPDLNLGRVTVKPPDMVLSPLAAVFTFGSSAIAGPIEELWVWSLSSGGLPVTASVAPDGSASVLVDPAYAPDEPTTWFGLELRSSDGFERFFMARLAEARGLELDPGCLESESITPGERELVSTCAESREVLLVLAVPERGAVAPSSTTLQPGTSTPVTVTSTEANVLIARDADDDSVVGALRVH